MKVKLWFDIINPPHVHLLSPLISALKEDGYNSVVTVKNFAETSALMSKKNIDYELIGDYIGKNKFSIIRSKLSRYIKLLVFLPDVKCSIACGHEASHISYIKRIPSILFLDNDISPNWLYSKFVSKIFCPEIIYETLIWNNPDLKDKIIPYKGFKENIYLANYIPDPNFLDQIPFSNFVTVRPENLKANYVKSNERSIVPEILKGLNSLCINVLFLPRYDTDVNLANNYNNVYIPSKALNGLDICYYSDVVLTGAGTFAREAALMGKPSVSFFAGAKLLLVDQHLVKEGKIVFSRDADDIVNFVKENSYENSRLRLDLSQSKIVFNEVLYKLKGYLALMD